VNNFLKKPLDFLAFMGYIIRIESERLKMMKKESIFTVTFTNRSTVFIKAMDKAHARRIVEKNGSTWTRGDDSVEMVIEKIERSC
jgi:hypothetical protein